MAGPNYVAAPLKAITREMIVEIARRTVSYGPFKEATYVGLGALEFVDLRLAYERLGIETLISIEENYPLERLEFNRPYDGIRIMQGTTNNKLPEIEELKSSRCVIWLDYTSRLRQSEQRDLAYLASVLAPGSALFVCLNRVASERDLDVVRNEFGDYFDESLPKTSYIGPNLADRQREVAERVVRKHLATRVDFASAELVIDVRYADSARMQVLGWVFGPVGADVSADCRLAELDFTTIARDGAPLDLAWPSLTLPEWNALSKQLPATLDSMVAPHKWVGEEHIQRFLTLHRWGRPMAAANA